MSDGLFGHKYSLIIGRKEKTEGVLRGTIVEAFSVPFRVDQITVDPRDFREFTDVQMQAEITYGKQVKARNSKKDEIKLFNLNVEDENFIRQGDFVILKAGYKQDEDLPTIFTGEIISKTGVQEGSNWVTKLVVGQSYRAVKDIYIALEWGTFKDEYETSILNDLVPRPEGPFNETIIYHTAYDILKDYIAAIKNAGIDFGSDWLIDRLSNSLSQKVLKNGYVMEGNAFRELERFFKYITPEDSQGFEYFLANNTLYIEPKGTTIYQQTFDLYPANLKSPPETHSSQRDAKTGSSVVTGYIFKLPLDGRMGLNKVLSVKFDGFPFPAQQGFLNRDREYRGDYRIVTVTHRLDYENSAWDTEVLCKREGVADG